MKKLFSALAAGLSAALLLTGPLAVPADAAREFEGLEADCAVYDCEGVLSYEETEQANKLIRSTSDTIDMYVAVMICGTESGFASDSAVERFADTAYDDLFNPQSGTDTDGVLLLINDATQYDYLTTSGAAQLYYSNAGSSEEDTVVWEILDSITPCLKSQDYVGAIERFCLQLEYYYERGIPNGAYAQNDDDGSYLYYQNGTVQSGEKLPLFYGVRWSKVLMIAFLLGAIVAIIALIIITSSYKLKKSLSPLAYVSNQETQFHQRDDIFLRTHTTKVHLGDGGGGGGGGGGGHSHYSGGGHSHGGGGHHR